MKNQLILIVTLMLVPICWSQNGINYKALIKDANGNIIANDDVIIQFTILKTSETGAVAYQENHTITTDTNGFLITNIGDGNPTVSTFNAIDWASDTHFLKVEISTGSGLVDMGTTQFMAVPYALNALKSSDNHWVKNDTIVGNLNDDVGIGSTTLNAKLGILHDASITDPHILVKHISNNYARIKFATNNSQGKGWFINGYVGGGGSSGSTYTGRNDILNFFNENSGKEVLTLKGNGKVGVGIVDNNPNADFHVEEEKKVLFGKDTVGTGFKLMVKPHRHAFRVGTLSGQAAYHYWSESNTGTYSFASGHNTRAQGLGATAMGTETEASNSYAFAIGFYTNANGEFSTAMGYNTDALGDGSTAMGYDTDATGQYATSMGNLTSASGNNSTAIGNQTNSQSLSAISLGSFNIGSGTPNSWVNEDPILEVGIGQSEATRNNALTILKDGRHGILTDQPKASLHVKDDGTVGSGTIVAVLESDISDRPILQFSETSNGDFASGMSIEYDGTGSGSDNKMNINNSNGLPIITFENGGQVGIGVLSPSFALQLPNNSTTGTARAKTWSTYSDQRIKSNITSLQYGLETVLSLRPVNYNQHRSAFVNSKLVLDSDSSKTIGLLAQEAYKIIPEAVIKPNNENAQLWGMDYDKLIPVLIKALQEQQAQIEVLKTKNKSQDTVLAKVLKRLSLIEKATQTDEKEDADVLARKD